MWRSALTRRISPSATWAMLRKASEVVLMRAISSVPSWDLKQCCWAVGGVSGWNERVGEAGSEWGGAGGLQNVMGRLGLGVCQFGLSERLGGL